MPAEPAKGDARPAKVRRSLAVVGASAGGVEALASLARGLPADLPIAIAAVVHMPAGSNSRLADVIDRAGPLPAVRAEHGRPFEAGTIYVAPPDSHMIVSSDRLFLVDGPRENGFRPAVDPLFRSAARALGPRAIGVILSGTMDDGAAGLAAIQSFGGATLVQDPNDALATGMPRAALDLVRPDHVAAAVALGPLLKRLARESVDVPDLHAARAREQPAGSRILQQDVTLIADPNELPPRGADLACPECGGALQEIQVGPTARFRCRTGHVYSVGTLLDTKSVELEAALWAALRALEEEASVAGRLAGRSRDIGAESAARRFERRQGDAAQRADVIREALHAIGERSPGAGPEDGVRSDDPGVASA